MLETWRQLICGKTLMRSLMNQALSSHTLESGVVLDLGGGKDPSYFNYLRRCEGTNIVNIDKQHGKDRDIDFEIDALPYEDGSIDQILMLNLLEHIYNHRFLVGEAQRVLKEGKTVIGFVPFLINYHADPHDYFRYTDEALELLFREAGFRNVTIRTIGMGPFSVNFNTLASFMPSIFNAAVWPLHWLLDRILLAMKPGFRKRFPLGYLFVLTK